MRLNLGRKAMASTDDTAALQHAVDTQRIVYLPSGRYRLDRHSTTSAGLLCLSDCIQARRNLILRITPLVLMVSARRKAMLLAPPNGSTIVTGIGLFTGGVNSRAVAAMWMAGKDSLMDDVRFLGGHGTNNPDGTRMNPYNNTHSGDPNALYRWDAQYPSLWVLNGGGGTFADIWTPVTFSQAGLYISDTKTEGHVYELSSEHHVRNEVKLKRVANWEIVRCKRKKSAAKAHSASRSPSRTRRISLWRRCMRIAS